MPAGHATNVELWEAYSLIAALALLPPLVFTFWLRSRERHDRNPVRTTLASFIFGGTIGVAVAIVLHQLFGIAFAQPNLNFGLEASFLTVVVAAPLAEEFAKGLGLGFLRGHVRELEDGIIYGAGLGLGFAATENLLYGYQALTDQNLDFAIWTIVLRVFSSMLLHLAASALLGFGYARIVLGGHTPLLMLPYFIVAAALHAAYNGLVTMQGFGGWGLTLALVLVVVVTSVLYRWIHVLDALPHTTRA